MITKIYVLTFNSGRKYVGRTADMQKRLQQHMSRLVDLNNASVGKEPFNNSKARSEYETFNGFTLSMCKDAARLGGLYIKRFDVYLSFECQCVTHGSQACFATREMENKAIEKFNPLYNAQMPKGKHKKNQLNPQQNDRNISTHGPRHSRPAANK